MTGKFACLSAVCCWGERPSNQPQAGRTGLVVDPTVGRVAPIRPLSPLLMSPIHQPLPEIASSPPPSPAEPRLPSSGRHGNNTSFETRGARLPLAAKPKDGLHSSCVSASSQRQARARRMHIVLLSCRYGVSRLRLANGTDYESRRTHRRTQQNFLPQPCGQRPVWEEAKMAQGASWR